jgi:hypothetical protein
LLALRDFQGDLSVLHLDKRQGTFHIGPFLVTISQATELATEVQNEGLATDSGAEDIEGLGYFARYANTVYSKVGPLNLYHRNSNQWLNLPEHNETVVDARVVSVTDEAFSYTKHPDPLPIHDSTQTLSKNTLGQSDPLPLCLLTLS